MLEAVFALGLAFFFLAVTHKIARHPLLARGTMFVNIGSPLAKTRFFVYPTDAPVSKRR